MPKRDLILRQITGSTLTHAQLDANLAQFFYSSSVSGDTVTLFQSGSGSIPQQTIQLLTASFTAPAANTEVKRATYVIINVEHATKYEFKYESGGSYVDYGIVAADGPLKVDIQPVAWKGGAGTTGHVSFVYRGD